MRFIRSGYAEALEQLADEGFEADAVLFDLGTSSMQLDTRERGFSYSYDAPLDMRMDPDSEPSARTLLAEIDERRLAGILRDYGEERYADAPSPARSSGGSEIAPLRSTQELVETICQAMPAPARFAGGHPAKRSFQAIRIAVNDELGQLDRALPAGVGAAAHGRRPRRDLLPLARGPARQALPRRARPRMHLPARPARVRLRPRGRGRAAEPARDRALGAEELAANPRASSARLRAARKLQQGDAR